MELWTLIYCVLPSIVTSITISSNGNSPDMKMIGGMMVDVQKGFMPMTEKPVKNIKVKRKLVNSTKLSINERYRRLIPYMTFYYANDLVSPTTGALQHNTNVEVEKAEIIEAKTIQSQEQRQPKKIVYSSHRNIPLYQGNRLTQYNIASANPTKLFYKEVPVYSSHKTSPNFNPIQSEHRLVLNNENYEFGRIPQKQIVKSPSAPFSLPPRHYLNFNNNDNTSGNIRFYIPEKEQAPRYKLVPYEQTPPVKVISQSEFIANKPPTPVAVLIPKEQVYIKPRPIRPQYYYENIQQPTNPRKHPTIVSESYYEKKQPLTPVIQPIIESGFKPIARPPVLTTEAPVYTSSLPNTEIPHFESEKEQTEKLLESPHSVPEINDFKPNYYQYVVEQNTLPPAYVQSNTVTLADLLNSLQLNKSIPKPITKENVGSSIRTLLQVLNALKAAVPEQNVEDIPVLSTPKPFVPNKIIEVTAKPSLSINPTSIINDDIDLHDEPYLAPVNTPSQHIDDFSISSGTSQRFPLPVTSDDEGGTPGRPGIDYPILTTIPQTAFNCKTQRYKGFFADPETRCQVWHYCDLNGGQASFLCPNGTIFSQAGLTCDWWFNVRCASTTQLYVLNESLYKYILPHTPKFPEDYSGPLVDKYLTLKFKEMEEQFRKNKNKQNAGEKMDSDEETSTEDSNEKETENSSENVEDLEKTSVVSEASVIIQSPGVSGNVERLHD